MCNFQIHFAEMRVLSARARNRSDFIFEPPIPSLKESDRWQGLSLCGIFCARFRLRLSLIKSTRQSFIVLSSRSGPTKICISCAPFHAGFLIRKKCLSARTNGSATDLNAVQVVP
jgi:hypothetical protein